MISRYRVVASCFEPDLSQPVEERRVCFRAHLTELLEEQSPDLVVVPEMALLPDIDQQPNCGAERTDGPTVACAAELAKQHHSNICLPIIEADGGMKYNTAIYIDRHGHIAGKYRKHTPTMTELELGIIPGIDKPELIVLDGLRVGTAICYDENYPDLIWNYIENGVDLLVFPAYTYGGKLMQHWAVACGVPLIAAFPWEAVIYDRDGSILADGGTWTPTIRLGNHPAWIGHSLNMQSRVYHLDYNQSKLSEMGRKYGNKLDIRLMVREGRFQVTMVVDDLSIEEVEKDMDLVSLQSYLVNTRVLADKLR